MAIKYIQDAGNNGVSLSSLVVTLSRPTQDGSLLALAVGTLTATISGVATDGGSETWSSLSAQASGGLRVQQWYAPNVPAGITTITITLSGADAVAADVAEFSGIATTTPSENPGGGSGSTANPTILPPSSPTGHQGLWFACANYIPTTSTVSSISNSWIALTSENAATSLALVTAYKIVTDASAQSVTWTLTPAVATTYVARVSGFKATNQFSKFYFHAASAAVSGTLPSSTVSATSPTQTVSGTNRAMNPTIGTSQTSFALTTLANTSAQPSLLGRFISAPIEAQTIGANGPTVQIGASLSSTNSNFHFSHSTVVWRPSTGAVVGRIYDLGPGTSVTTTSEANYSIADTGGTITAQDGDVLITELWRDATVQSMSTAYTNTAFYDGTTESSTTSNAAYISFQRAVSMLDITPRGKDRLVLQAINRSSVI